MSDKWEIIQGDALKVLEGFAPGTFDAVITHSGGEKQVHYIQVFQHGRECAPSFRGGCQGPAFLDPLGGRVAV